MPSSHTARIPIEASSSKRAAKRTTTWGEDCFTTLPPMPRIGASNAEKQQQQRQQQQLDNSPLRNNEVKNMPQRYLYCSSNSPLALSPHQQLLAHLCRSLKSTITWFTPPFQSGVVGGQGFVPHVLTWMNKQAVSYVSARRPASLRALLHTHPLWW